MVRVMKDSGVEWIGVIPKHWKVLPVKYILRNKSVKNHPNEEVLSLYRDYGVVHKNSRDDNHNVTSEDTSTYKLVDVGDFVINKMKAWQGSMAVSSLRGIISPAYYICTFIKDDIDKTYFQYLIKNQAYLPEFRRLSTGMRIGQWDLNFDDFKQIPYLLPTKIEQVKISRYLNEKCKEIESAIDNTKATIEEYKKYKQSVITEAVTKGLDPDVEMRDSGIEWNKHIPSHWKIVNGRRLFELRKDKAMPDDRQLTASQKYGIMYQDEFMQMENQRVVTVQKDFDILKHVEPNDFVISMRSFQGGLEYSQLRGCISSAYVMLIPNEKVYCPYFRWLFKSVKYINALQSTSNLVRDGQAMRFSNFVQIPLFQIPIEEQKEIAEYLDAKCSEIDILISKKQQIASELETYKKSLIYECVTGKVEV